MVHIACLFCLIFFNSLGATLTGIESFLSAVVIPIYLIVVNIINCTKIKNSFFLFNLLMMELSVILGCLFQYFNWGITSGALFSPDLLTLLFLNESLKGSLTVVVVVGGIIQLVLFFKNEKLSNWVDELEDIYKKYTY